MTYNSSTFQVTSAGDFVAIGNTPATPNFNNLGSFSLDNTPFAYSGSHFDLLVSFTAPVGTSPSFVLVEDLIVGTVNTTGGGILIDFDNTPKLFTYDGGSFLFSVNDVSLTAGLGTSNSVPFSGQIVVTAVPEPSTWAMMILGFLGLGFLAHRRNNDAPTPAMA